MPLTFRLNPGMTAWVKGSPYKAGDVVPAGTTRYNAEWWYSPNAAEQAAGMTGRQVLYMQVDVNTSWIANIGAFNKLRQAKLALGQFRASP